jgi:hypothetical protein
MATPVIHAQATVNRYGGRIEDYVLSISGLILQSLTTQILDTEHYDTTR